MPRAILEFNLHEDREEYEMAVHAGEMHCALYDLYNHLRATWKYGEDEAQADWARETWQFVSENLDKVSIP